jgi:hypothetical protein
VVPGDPVRSAGFGLTGVDPRGDYGVECEMKILAAPKDQLRVDSAALIGNSLGGRIA